MELSTTERNSMDAGEDIAEPHRRKRETEQQEHSAQGTWTELQASKGGALDLYLFGTPRRIRHLELDVLRVVKEMRFFRPILADAQPTALDLRLRASQILDNGNYSWLSAHICHPALRGL